MLDNVLGVFGLLLVLNLFRRGFFIVLAALRGARDSGGDDDDGFPVATDAVPLRLLEVPKHLLDDSRSSATMSSTN